MSKKTFIDGLYGKITYKEGYWEVKEGVIFKINNKEIKVKTEIDVYNELYEEFNFGLLSEGLMKLYEKEPDSLEGDEAEIVKKDQKELYKKFLVDNINEICGNIEEAALKKREEIIEDETEETFSKIVGKDKAQRVFSARTREEKLESLELKKLRIFKDQIEITCTCDWFKPSGGFVIFKDGSVEMFYVDSMSI